MTHAISSSSSTGAFFSMPSSSVPSCREERKKEVEEAQAPIDLLADDAWIQIFNRATNGYRDKNTLCAIRAVNRKFSDIIDTYHLKNSWSKLHNEVKNPSLRSLVHQIVFVNRFVSGVIASAIDPGYTQWDAWEQASLLNRIESMGPSWFSRFSQLTQRLREKGAPIPAAHAVIGLELSVYENMQQRLEAAVETAWTHIQKQINFKGAPIPANAEAIRLWLNDRDNAGKIDLITELNLTYMNVTVLPPEIGKFSQLIKLYLSNTQTTALTPEIGNLSQLTKLDLYGNQLISLPSEIGKLSQLKTLRLYANQITALPSEIGNLSQLKALDLNENRITALPSEIGKLSQLAWFRLDDNPLIFILDKDLNQLSSWKSVNFQNTMTTFSACSSYRCQTPLASLCQQIHLGKQEDLLRSTFETLSDEMQQRIRQAWAAIPSSSEAGADLFADRASCVEAVITALQDKWGSLSRRQRNQAYAQVAILAGQPEEDACWNTIRFIDAMELVTST